MWPDPQFNDPLVLFAPWTWCLLAVLHRLGRRQGGRGSDDSKIIAIAAVAEFIQIWFPHYDPEWKGFLASVIGLSLGREWFTRTR